jgi:hypothetical protein
MMVLLRISLTPVTSEPYPEIKNMEEKCLSLICGQRLKIGE